MIDKSHYSFLIAFERQLSRALDADDIELANVLQSLAVCLELLHANFGPGVGDDDGGLPESVDDVDAPGDDTPLGAALARIAELERAAAAVDVPQQQQLRRSATPQPERLDLGGKRRKPTVLKGAKRRGRK